MIEGLILVCSAVIYQDKQALACWSEVDAVEVTQVAGGDIIVRIDYEALEKAMQRQRLRTTGGASE